MLRWVAYRPAQVIRGPMAWLVDAMGRGQHGVDHEEIGEGVKVFLIRRGSTLPLKISH